MAKLNRDGVNIHYEAHGDGPAILLSHGYSATCRMWDGQIAAFKDRYKVIVWDMRGHGESDYPTDAAAYSEALTVGDMAAILDACGETRAIIGGLSLGGYMTMAFHLRHPERCRALMLFDTGPGFKKSEAREAWNQRARARGDDLDARGLAALGTSDEVRMSQHRSASGSRRRGARDAGAGERRRHPVAGKDRGADTGSASERTTRTFSPRRITWRRKSPARESRDPRRGPCVE